MLTDLHTASNTFRPTHKIQGASISRGRLQVVHITLETGVRVPTVAGHSIPREYPHNEQLMTLQATPSMGFDLNESNLTITETEEIRPPTTKYCPAPRCCEVPIFTLRYVLRPFTANDPSTTGHVIPQGFRVTQCCRKCKHSGVRGKDLS